MERREFLKLTLGLTAAAGAIAAAATTAQAAPLLPDSTAPPNTPPKSAETAQKPDAPQPETAARDDIETDTEMSAQRRWRRRYRRWWRPRRRRIWRRRRVIYY